MDYKQTIIEWQQAVDHFDIKNYDQSIELFNSFASNSKHYLNLGILNHKINNLDEAIEAFSMCVKLDKHSAVGYFARGSVFFSLNLTELALQDFHFAYDALRNNSYIDYSQLGLQFLLHESLIVHNIALCFLALGRTAKGLECLTKAYELASADDHVNKVGKLLHRL